MALIMPLEESKIAVIVSNMLLNGSFKLMDDCMKAKISAASWLPGVGKTRNPWELMSMNSIECNNSNTWQMKQLVTWKKYKNLKINNGQHFIIYIHFLISYYTKAWSLLIAKSYSYQGLSIILPSEANCSLYTGVQPLLTACIYMARLITFDTPVIVCFIDIALSTNMTCLDASSEINVFKVASFCGDRSWEYVDDYF